MIMEKMLCVMEKCWVYEFSTDAFFLSSSFTLPFFYTLNKAAVSVYIYRIVVLGIAMKHFSSLNIFLIFHSLCALFSTSLLSATTTTIERAPDVIDFLRFPRSAERVLNNSCISSLFALANALHYRRHSARCVFITL